MNKTGSMDQYIVQLVEDFRESAKKVPSHEELVERAGIDLPEKFKDCTDVELYLHGPQEKLSEILGVEKDALPPPEKLTNDQIHFLLDEMERLLAAYHFFPDFPPGLPDSIKYRLLCEKLDSEFVLIGKGRTHIEFCYYIPEECPFPEKYCQCKDFEEWDWTKIIVPIPQILFRYIFN